MWAPSQAKPFLCMAYALCIRADHPSRHARVPSSIKNHRSAVCTHSRDDVGILWLIARFVHLSSVIDLLNYGELDLHVCRFLRGAATITSNLLLLFIVVCCIRLHRVW